jgi:hypothetical protein
MAINLATRYPGRTNPADTNYPQGSFKNRSAPGVLDGSYLEKDWANDIHAFFQQVLAEAEITPNGAVDNATNSQYYEAIRTNLELLGVPTAPTAAPGTNTTQLATMAALQAATSGLTTPDATETVKGKVEKATVAEAQAFTAEKYLDAALLNSALQGANQSLATNGYQKLPGGLIIQWGTLPTTSDDGTANITWPIVFPTAVLNAQSTISTFNSNPINWAPTSITTSDGTFRVTGDPGGSTAGYYFIIGY